MPNFPPEYARLTDSEVSERIAAIRRRLDGDLVILGHHYMTDEVIRFADFRGDSLGLSRRAAAVGDAKYIVFCGVSFMAETAAMLCSPEQIVVSPAREAPCPMARMVDAAEATLAWETLSSLWEDSLVPVTYQNSTAEVKAFCGRHGGAVCTSSNAQAIFRWALNQKEHILFFPDEHLGRNTALALGMPAKHIGVWDPDDAHLEASSYSACTVVVWKGYCNVHTRFTVQHVEAARQRYPRALIIVHPECPAEVVSRADQYGSTAQIIEQIGSSEPGTTWVVGTEINMVNRLAAEHPDKSIVPLCRSLCSAMFRTNTRNLLYVLEGLALGDPVHVVQVDEDTRQWANLALKKMLEARP